MKIEEEKKVDIRFFSVDVNSEEIVTLPNWDLNFCVENR